MACVDKNSVEYMYAILALGIFQVWCAWRFTDILSEELEEQLLNDTLREQTKTPIFTGRTGKKFTKPKNKPQMYHILTWNENDLIFPKTLEKGQSIFPRLNCAVNNCVFYKNEHYATKEYLKFDVIIFNERDLFFSYGPELRNSSQLYVFFAHEPPTMAFCEDFNDGFFNWTFTYRLDSTVVWNYFTVCNSLGEAVASNIERDYQWQAERKFIETEIKAVLSKKKKAVVWIIKKDYCFIFSYVDEYVAQLKTQLNRLNLTLDSYGACSGAQCDNNDCDTMIRNDYYFYIAFESRYALDYVTDKVVQAYKNYAVPIVHGGVNYNRFLPPGSFLNAEDVKPDFLAIKIKEIIQNSRALEDYFTWTNWYTIGFETPDHPLCKLCVSLNKPRSKPEIVSDFRSWWNGLDYTRWC